MRFFSYITKFLMVVILAETRCTPELEKLSFGRMWAAIVRNMLKAVPCAIHAKLLDPISKEEW
jgi:hypothetical protein